MKKSINILYNIYSEILKCPHLGETCTKFEHKLCKQTNCGVGKKQKKVLFHFDFLKKYTKKEKIEYKMKMKERAES